MFAGIDGAAAGSLAEFSKVRAMELLESSDAKLRTLVYQECRGFGEGGREMYRGILEESVQFHQRKIEESMDLAMEEANRFSGAELKLREQRAFAVDYMLANLVEDEGALAKLRLAYRDAEWWLKEARAQHGRALASMGVINSSSTAIDEMRRELGYCSGVAVTISQHTFNRVLSKYSTYASNLHDRIGEMSAFRQSANRYENAMQHNRKQIWATPEMRAFADLLNEHRYTLGLPMLYLEKRLSVACEAHTQEMVKLNYFAHQSPVDEHATPDLRAENAKYEGTFVGENIFFYATPRSAASVFEAWWKSDGHRFVMFDPKSDQLGLSNRTGTHWALMTGMAAERAAVKSAGVK